VADIQYYGTGRRKTATARVYLPSLDEGISEAVAKVVYDATPAQQVTLVGIGGRAAVDWKRPVARWPGR